MHHCPLGLEWMTEVNVPLGYVLVWRDRCAVHSSPRIQAFEQNLMDHEEGGIVDMRNLLEILQGLGQLSAKQLMLRDLDQLKVFLACMISQVSHRLIVTERIKHL